MVRPLPRIPLAKNSKLQKQTFCALQTITAPLRLVFFYSNGWAPTQNQLLPCPLPPLTQNSGKLWRHGVFETTLPLNSICRFVHRTGRWRKYCALTEVLRMAPFIVKCLHCSEQRERLTRPTGRPLLCCSMWGSQVSSVLHRFSPRGDLKSEPSILTQLFWTCCFKLCFMGVHSCWLMLFWFVLST